MPNIKQFADGSTGWLSDVEGIELFRLGGIAKANGNLGSFRGKYIIKVGINAAADGVVGALGSFFYQGTGLIINQAYLDVTTASSAACGVNIGIATTAAAVGTPVVVSPGSGYTNNDVVTAIGHVGTASAYTATVSSGVVTSLAIQTAGAVTQNPAPTGQSYTNVNVSGGTGSGLVVGALINGVASATIFGGPLSVASTGLKVATLVTPAVPLKLNSGVWIVATAASGASAGLVANLYLEGYPV